MAELGFLAFARSAWEVGRAALPPYRTRFSKHPFTQPQLLAIVCLMRYEDWTFREAEVRFGEHRELRQTLGLSSVPDFTTRYQQYRRQQARAQQEAVRQEIAAIVRRLHDQGRCPSVPRVRSLPKSESLLNWQALGGTVNNARKALGTR